MSHGAARGSLDRLLEHERILFCCQSRLMATLWVRSERGRYGGNGLMPDRLVGSCTTLEEGLRVCRDQQPTLLITTQLVEEGSGLELVVAAKRMLPELRTLLFLQHDPADHHSLSFLALLLRQRGDHQLALQCFRRAHVLAPLALRPRRGLEHPHRPALRRAQELAQQGAVEATVEICRSILRQHPSHSEALLQLAAILRRLGCHALACACLDRLLQAHPDHAHGYSSLAELLNSMGGEVGSAVALKRAQLLDSAIDEPC
ncbi:MAG: tetratricopeptide repeat protein [Cyanobium sp.]